MAKTRAQESDAAGSLATHRIVGVGTILLGVAAALWFGAATVIAYRLAYPPTLANGRTDVSGPHVPADLATSRADPKRALGADFENLTLKTDDGETAGAWFVRGTRPEVAVVLLPPAGGTRWMMMPWLKFIHEAGFSAIVTDSGDRAAEGVSWGWRERKFAWAAAEALKARGFTRLSAIGISEGGAAAILAQGERPTFRAIVADSAYANLATMFRRVPSLGGLNPAFLNTILFETRFLIGRRLDQISPADAARNLYRCALLLIQNRDDELTSVQDADAIYNAAVIAESPRMVESPVTYSGSGHADAVFEQTNYVSVVTAFLDFQLGGTPLAPATGGK